MFGMGFQEIILIAVLGILVIGPEKLPEVARTIGKVIANLKRATNDLRESIHTEMETHSELKEFQEFQRELDSGVQEIGSTTRDYIEREVEKETRELEKLEKDLAAGGADPGQLTDPAAGYQAGPGDFPQEAAEGQPVGETQPEAPAKKAGKRVVAETREEEAPPTKQESA